MMMRLWRKSQTKCQSLTLHAVLLTWLFVGILGGLYWTILLNMAWQWWDDPNYSHGFLVPVFSLYLVWRQRETLSALPFGGSWLGFPVLLAGVGALVLGDIGAEYFLTRSSLILVAAGLIIFHLGTGIFRVATFPLFFLFFMVPLPAILFNALAFPLQHLAAENATWTLRLLGVPVFLDGNIIYLSNTSLGVTEACSGIRSLISLLALAAAWAYLTLSGFWAWVVLVASVVPITVVANAGRVVITGLISQWFGVAFTQGFFHTFSGWAIFLFAFTCFLGVHRLIRLLGICQGKDGT